MQASSSTSSSRSFIRTLNFKGLYNGVGSVIITTIPASALFFVAYENAKWELSHLFNQPFTQLTSSCLAELIASIAIAPADTIKQRAQIESNQKSSLSIATSFFKSPSAWSDVKYGYKAVVIRNLPITAAYFPLYENLKLNLENRYQISKPYAALVSGGLSAIPLALITTPLDVIKTRIMLNQVDSHDKSNLMKVGLSISRTQGFKFLFKSAWLRISVAGIGAGLELGCYEYAKKHLRNFSDE